MQSDIVQLLDYWRNEMQRTIQALESNPKFSDVVDGNRSIHTTLGMAKTEILFSRTTIANQTEAMRASDAEITRLTEALRAAEEREKALRGAVERLRSGYADAVSGYSYILTQHGRLEGVGFDRVMDHYHDWVAMPEREGLLAGSHTLAGAKP